MTNRNFFKWILAICCLWLAVFVAACQPATVGDFLFFVGEGGVPDEQGWDASSVCAEGDGANDTEATDVIVDPTAGSFLRAEFWTTAAITSPVFTRTKVKLAPEESMGLQDDWYQRIPHGLISGARQLAFVDQALSFDLSGATDPDVAAIGSIPSIGHPALVEVHTNFSLNSQGNVVGSCEALIRVWAEGDPNAVGAIGNNVAHPHEHTSVEHDFSEQFNVFKYPTGPDFPATCHVADEGEATDQTVQGEFRIEPIIGNSGPDVITGDVWVHTGFGNTPQFNWRVRATNLNGGGSDLTQSGQRWRFELPGNLVAQDLGQAVTWDITSHFHLSPDEFDTDGLICESVVEVS